MGRVDTVSSRIVVLRFPLIVGVVFIHNFMTTVKMAQGPAATVHTDAWVDFVRYFISQGLARVCVPIFFLISGYLFFLGDWSWEKYGSKLRRRVSTLLVPLLFWNLASIAIFAIAQAVPATAVYFAGTAWPPVRSFTALDYGNALLGITKMPIDYPMWFIRDLIVLVLLAPVIQVFLARRVAPLFLVVLAALWFTGKWPVFYPSVEATLFFCLGGYLSRFTSSLKKLDKFAPRTSVLFLAGLCASAAIQNSNLYLHQATIALGIPSIWWLAGLAARGGRTRIALTWLSTASFLVFAAHEPLLTIFRKVAYKVLHPASGVVVLALYLLIPIVLIALLVAANLVLRKIAPRVMDFVTGSGPRGDAKEIGTGKGALAIQGGAGK